MIRAYLRCNGGHYFAASHCPLDGWSSPASQELAAAVDELAQRGAAPSVEQLRTVGVSEETLARIIVIEFGSSWSAFELIAPEGYVVDGEWIQQRDFDARFI